MGSKMVKVEVKGIPEGLAPEGAMVRTLDLIRHTHTKMIGERR